MFVCGWIFVTDERKCPRRLTASGMCVCMCVCGSVLAIFGRFFIFSILLFFFTNIFRWIRCGWQIIYFFRSKSSVNECHVYDARASASAFTKSESELLIISESANIECTCIHFGLSGNIIALTYTPWHEGEIMIYIHKQRTQIRSSHDTRNDYYYCKSITDKTSFDFSIHFYIHIHTIGIN